MTMTLDLINGLFEFLAGFMVLNHCRVMYRHKSVRGVSILSTVFFCIWGLWNLVYYPSLGQWASFAGGCWITATNILWVGLMIRYRRN